mmetsp:Transcript_46624/g.110873  ORF Transcript_46624/g.110873 Transcript_46624/m.110873 type:complete len:488 (-) Transcript_46624:136-1599(-)|eukprot:CAMPEP_0178389300 /NCGR_PEP_ID=MMETSP0689_2-20121128/10044_1 /TAXON_ID=160604 /ORGANISM="Amphidinium massartii, Strain CS-259" /LENGTH=487 /DNA_ID=CAMNT_0020009743 /DNA_START=39 /DNA_END=1502 /DNA_ORIENTATION=+
MASTARSEDETVVLQRPILQQQEAVGAHAAAEADGAGAPSSAASGSGGGSAVASVLVDMVLPIPSPAPSATTRRGSQQRGRRANQARSRTRNTRSLSTRTFQKRQRSLRPVSRTVSRRVTAEAAAESWMQREAQLAADKAAAQKDAVSARQQSSASSSSAGAAAAHLQQEQQQEQKREESRTPALSQATMDLHRAAKEYPPLAACMTRLDVLRQRNGRKRVRRWVADLIHRLSKVPRVLTSRAGSVRFVACSDTHRYHDHVHLPQGEVFLYAGDAVGNYGRKNDLLEQFEQFLDWLKQQCQRYRHCFFIAGNHETILDDSHGDSTVIQRTKDTLKTFLKKTPNCTYLENSSAQYRGIRLYGSPVTISRLETEGKRYYSRAFERFGVDRKELWSRLPDSIDVLMTHCPPRGHLCGDAAGDPYLAERLRAMDRPPKYHVFGHDHGYLGVDRDRNHRIVFMNVAQDEYLRKDPKGGGCALIFDVDAHDGT